jgi:hypothetical protein
VSSNRRINFIRGERLADNLIKLEAQHAPEPSQQKDALELRGELAGL